MARAPSVLSAVALLCHLIALALPSIDTHFGELVAGFGVRGYQCWFGLWLMPLAVPVATPLWVALGLGNLWVLARPIIRFHGARSARLLSLGRWVMVCAIAAWAGLTVWREAVGLRALHVGYGVWAAGLIAASAATWWPAPPLAATSRPSRGVPRSAGHD